MNLSCCQGWFVCVSNTTVPSFFLYNADINKIAVAVSRGCSNEDRYGCCVWVCCNKVGRGFDKGGRVAESGFVVTRLAVVFESGVGRCTMVQDMTVTPNPVTS